MVLEYFFTSQFSQSSLLFYTKCCRPSRVVSFKYKLKCFDNPTLSSFDYTHVAVTPYKHCKQEPNLAQHQTKHNKETASFRIASSTCAVPISLPLASCCGGFDENNAPFSS